ncbi:MAG: cation:proton antiporter [Phycisphaeraceae bacterium]|nr:MAG: cation:proton antiporter [Phycisphaeraceae bacterium]
MPGDHNLFGLVAATMLLAVAIGAAALLLRQPLIVAFIAVGIAAGPAGLGWITPGRTTQLLATLGVSVLLFLVGLKLDLAVIRSMGPVALATGVGQVVFTSVFGFFIALALGLDPIPALYVAVALTFSSTIIIVKLLSDKREIDSLHGRIAVGLLIVQDLLVILAMIALVAVGPARGEGHPTDHAPSLWGGAFAIAAKGVGLLAGVGLLMRFVLPPLVHLIARSVELLILFATAWAVGLAAAAEFLGLSKEVGAFLAGVSLAATPYRDAIGGRLVSLRDFLLLFFFLGLGASLDLSRLGAQVVPAAVLSVFVLVGNPLIVMAIMGVMGYRRRTGFLTGLTVAQISEFSLILAALGVALGHINPDTMGLITLVGIVTIGLSTYMILYSQPLYQRLAPWLGVFERRVPHREAGHDHPAEDPRPDIILFGLGRYGERLARGLLRAGRRILAVDFDPRAVDAARRDGIHARYGDAEDPECPAMLPLGEARIIVSTVPVADVNLALLHHLRARGFVGPFAAAAHSVRDARHLESHGVEVVLMPFHDAADQAAERLAGLASPAVPTPPAVPRNTPA